MPTIHSQSVEHVEAKEGLPQKPETGQGRTLETATCFDMLVPFLLTNRPAPFPPLILMPESPGVWPCE